jgi:hypothetical protein
MAGMGVGGALLELNERGGGALVGTLLGGLLVGARRGNGGAVGDGADDGRAGRGGGFSLIRCLP